VCEQLLLRHGVLTRAAVSAEGHPGGFSALYPVLKALEEAGRIRRGYFVAGLGGSQFAHPGAVDRLRAVREAPADAATAVVLAAGDPANPYGLALPWPREGRAQRAAGAHVVLVDGELAAYVARGQREVAAFLPDDEPARTRMRSAAARGLAGWMARTGRSTLGWATQDAPLNQQPLGAALREAGLMAIGPGFRLPSAPPPAPEGELLEVFEGEDSDEPA
jgi:ATP-dependent Lhr-like helicase